VMPVSLGNGTVGGNIQIKGALSEEIVVGRKNQEGKREGRRGNFPSRKTSCIVRESSQSVQNLELGPKIRGKGGTRGSHSSSSSRGKKGLKGESRPSPI